MFLKNINPFVRQILVGGIDSEHSKNDLYSYLQSRDCRLFYITEGSGKIILSGKTYDLYKGCTVLFQPGTQYMWQTQKLNFIIVNFDYTMNFSHITTTFHPIKSELFQQSYIIESVTFDDASILNRPLFISSAPHIEYFLRTMASAYYLQEDYAAELLSSYMKSIIVTLVGTICKNAPHTMQSKEAVEKIIQYIQANYTEHLNNADIANLFHFNPSYLNKVFKEHTGLTIHQFLVNYRMNIAMELLRTQNSPISKIAIDAGFSDVPHFVKSFKKQMKKTPREYRNSSKL